MSDARRTLFLSPERGATETPAHFSFHFFTRKTTNNTPPRSPPLLPETDKLSRSPCRVLVERVDVLCEHDRSLRISSFPSDDELRTLPLLPPFAPPITPSSTTHPDSDQDQDTDSSDDERPGFF